VGGERVVHKAWPQHNSREIFKKKGGSGGLTGTINQEQTRNLRRIEKQHQPSVATS